jgi:23S rRNA (adenine2503-C2)-methyltransferase
MDSSTTQKTPFRGATLAEVEAVLRRRGGRVATAKFGETLYHAFQRDAAASFTEVVGVNAEKLAAAEELFDVSTPEIVERVDSWDRSARFVLKMKDGAIAESVLLHHHGLWTVCVSSQAGCALACRFCATGLLGLKRDLLAHEIVGQLYVVARAAKVRVSDVVFMGMGEPLMNETEVYKACAIMTEAHGLQISAKRLVISTAGVAPAVHRFVDRRLPYRLVFSLGSAVPEKRLRLMPVQRAHSFEAFLDAVRRYEAFRRGKHVTLEYVAIKNFTMGEDDEEALRALHKTGLRFILNVIPLNPVDETLEAPTMVETRAWTERLRPIGFPIKVRYSGGKDRLSGCGQLGRALLERGDLRANSGVSVV